MLGNLAVLKKHSSRVTDVEYFLTQVLIVVLHSANTRYGTILSPFLAFYEKPMCEGREIKRRRKEYVFLGRLQDSSSFGLVTLYSLFISAVWFMLFWVMAAVTKWLIL